MRLWIATLACLLAAGPALSQGYSRGEIVRGLCRQDGCDEFSIAEKQPVTSDARGALFRTRVRIFHASQQGRKDQGEENGYVLCSMTKPAIVSEQGGQTTALLLAPSNERQSRESTNFYTLYFSLCHGLEAGRSAARDWRAVAQSLSYAVPLQQSRTVSLKQPESILSLVQ